MSNEFSGVIGSLYRAIIYSPLTAHACVNIYGKFGLL
jgi:hypothetical protein